MRKILSAILAFALLAGISLPANAERRSKIVANITEYYHLDYIGNPIVTPEKTRPGDEILIPIERKGFKDANGMYIDWDGKQELGPDVSQLSNNGITAHILIATGMETIRDIKIVEFKPTSRIRCQSAIRIRFKKELYSTRETEYYFDVYLKLNGDNVSQTSNKITFNGMLSNALTIIDSTNYDYVYSGDGNTLIPRTTFNNIRVDMGEGVSIYTDLLNGEKYYAVAEFMDTHENPVAKEFPSSIHSIYTVKTVNMKTDGFIVKFTDLDPKEKLYVYNVKGDLIGMSNDFLPYSTTYYLAKEEVDITSMVDVKAGTATGNGPKSKAFLEFQNNFENN